MHMNIHCKSDTAVTQVTVNALWSCLLFLSFSHAKYTHKIYANFIEDSHEPLLPLYIKKGILYIYLISNKTYMYINMTVCLQYRSCILTQIFTLMSNYKEID